MRVNGNEKKTKNNTKIMVYFDFSASMYIRLKFCTNYSTTFFMHLLYIVRTLVVKIISPFNQNFFCFSLDTWFLSLLNANLIFGSWRVMKLLCTVNCSSIPLS